MWPSLWLTAWLGRALEAANIGPVYGGAAVGLMGLIDTDYTPKWQNDQC